MLDAIRANQLDPCPDGVRALVGPFRLVLACPLRDRELLLARSCPLELVIELELERAGPRLCVFADETRRELYRVLRQVPGVGMRSALAVLDCGEAHDVLRAVAGADSSFFRGVPGLGAGRISSIVTVLRRRYPGRLPAAVPVPVEWLVSAREALVASGLRADAAETLLVASLDDHLPVGSDKWAETVARACAPA